MPLPNPFCGLCKPKGLAVFIVAYLDTMIAFFFLVYVIVMLIFQSTQGKVESVLDNLIGFIIFFGAIFNLILHPTVICMAEKKSLKGCRIWLILRVLGDGITCFSLYNLMSQTEGARVTGVMIILGSAPIIFHLYVWYVVLVFTYQLHLDAAKAATTAAPVPPSAVIVERGTNSNARQQFGTLAVRKPNSTGTGTNAPNPSSILSSGDDNKNNTTTLY